MTKYENLERFKKWIDENMKADVYDFQRVLYELETCHGSTGSEHYELNSFYTKSGTPECYYYDYLVKRNSDGDVVEEIYIF